MAVRVAFITMAAFYGMVFLQSLYFQQQRGHSALVTGLLFLPMTALVAVLSYLAPRIASRFGRLAPIVDLSGVLNTFPQMGGSLGVAVFGAVVDASTHFTSGLRIDFTAIAVLIGVAALWSLTLRGDQGMRG